MIIRYDKNGNIGVVHKGNYSLERLNFPNERWIEVKNQDLSEKKVDTENKVLVEKNG